MDTGDAPLAVTARLVAVLLQYVARAAGDDAVVAVHARVPGAAPLPELAAGEGWVPREVALGLAAAAADVCGDPQIGRRAGEELFRRALADGGPASFFRASGSPAAALGLVVQYANRMTFGKVHEVVAVADDHVLVHAHAADPEPAARYFCDMATGYWAQVPTVFGAVGTATELRCQHLGAEACVFRVGWSDVVVDPATVGASAEHLDAVLDDFARMQRRAASLAGADTVAEALDAIVDAVDATVVAPELVAFVHTEEDGLVLASRRLDDAAALAVVAGVAGGHALDRPAIVVPLATPGAPGALVAILPPHANPPASDQRLLDALGLHAAAAVEAVLTRRYAERSRATASALLVLARSLAEVTTTEDVGERLVAAVPGLVAARTATMWRWDAPTESMRFVAAQRPAGLELPYRELTVADIPNLRELSEHPEPELMEVGDVGPTLAAGMASWGETHTATMPIVARGRFLGFLTAGFLGPPVLPRTDLFARLQGAADLAATAFDNAGLLDQIRHQALHDALTGLPNRPLLEDRAQRALAAAERRGGGISLLFIDLDRFKNVNDTLGHRAGDELIRQAAGRLCSVLRASDTLARMGGDEFVVLLPDTGEPDAALAVGEALLGALHAPFQIGGRDLYISASIGIACSPDHGGQYAQLLQHADVAMYEAKARGRRTVAVHAELMPARSHLLDLETDLHVALAEDQLDVLFQPQVDLSTMRIVGVEALARWRHPRLGTLLPESFLALAEQTGLVVDLDRRVRGRALAAARRWRNLGLDLSVSVNLSAVDLARPELAGEVLGELSAAALEPSVLVVELNDHALLRDATVLANLRQLDAAGVRVAADDAGPGSSVLGRLADLPLHALKVDRGLVGGPTATTTRIVEAVVAMAHQLGMVVIAEGVETPEQGGMLRRFGCDQAQGFLFSAPVAEDEVSTLVRQLNSQLLPAGSARA